MDLDKAIEMVDEACYHYDRELYENCNYLEAFYVVLNELNNRIPIKDIERKMANIDENIDNLNNSCEFESAYVQARLDELRTEKEILKDLLNKEKK